MLRCFESSCAKHFLRGAIERKPWRGEKKGIISGRGRLKLAPCPLPVSSIPPVITSNVFPLTDPFIPHAFQFSPRFDPPFRLSRTTSPRSISLDRCWTWFLFKRILLLPNYELPFKKYPLFAFVVSPCFPSFVAQLFRESVATYVTMTRTFLFSSCYLLVDEGRIIL